MKKFVVNQRIVGTALTAVAMSVVMVGCGGMKSATSILGSNAVTSNASSLSGKMSMSVVDKSSSKIVYTDATETTAANSLTLEAGKEYKIRLTHANPPLGTTYELVATQTNIPDGSKVTLTLVLGDNAFTPAQSGSYSYKITAKAPSGAETTMSYIAAVGCSATSTLSPGSLNVNALSVSAGAAANLYNLSAMGLTSTANGTAPYQCAWDPTGTGIKDTAFKSCDVIESNFYSNFVGSRKVGILVKDACGTTVTVTKVLNFAAVTPAMPGNVFISGGVSNPTASAVGDLRVDGVNYLATNNALSGNLDARNIVQPAYASGKFQIYSSLTYGMASSVRFGVQIKLKGLEESTDSSGKLAVSANNASIESVTFTTDQAGDSSSALSFSGTGAVCSLTNQNTSVEVIQGEPCSAGQSGTNKKTSVEVWGHYKCVGLNSANGAKIDFEGNFDGIAHSSDDCNGGGGGGGGVKPINL